MSKHKKALIEENPKLAQAILGWELTLRNNLHKAREAAGMEQWQLAEKLGWSLKKVQQVESTETDLKFSDLRLYLLATRHLIEFHLRGEKSLG